MTRRESEIVVDLRGLELGGEVLDIGWRSMGVIYRALRGNILRDSDVETAASVDFCTDIEDCDWVYGNPAELPFSENSFDAVTAFFSMSYIKHKYMRNKTIKEVARALKPGGKLYIWDISANFRFIKSKKNVKALLKENEEVKLEFGYFRIPWNFNLNSLAPVVSRYFTIVDKRECMGYFYIEAEKKDDAI